MTTSAKQPSSNWSSLANFQARHTRRYPPFGKQLNELRRQGLIPDQRIIVSTDWELGAAYPRIVIPSEHQVDQLIFDYLAGLSVQIVHHHNEAVLVAKLVESIIKVKPKILAVFNYDHAKQGSHKYPAYRLIHSSLELVKNEF